MAELCWQPFCCLGAHEGERHMTDVGDEFMAPRPFAHPTRDPREKEERLRAVVFAARRLLASLDCRLDDVELMAEKLRYRLDQLGAADEPTTATGGEPS